MNRLNSLGAFGLLAAFVVSALIGLTSISGHGDEGGETVRIIARLHDDGNIEFGLRTTAGNQLPRLRVFSATISDENWRRSSIVELSDGTEVRIIARRSGNPAVEFGLRIDEPRRQFLPTRRFFPRSATVGRWLVSSPLLLPAPPDEDDHDESAAPPEPPEPSEPDQEGDDSDDEGTTETERVERISGGHRDGLIVQGGIVGNPSAPVLISEYGDPF